MVITNAFEYRLLTIQEKAFIRNDLDRTDTERGRIEIFQLIALI